mgnify:CR=1 FL=1
MAQIQAQEEIVQTVWNNIRAEAREMMTQEPMLGSFFLQSILNQQTFAAALGFQLANRLASAVMPAVVLRELINEVYNKDPNVITAAALDLRAVVDRDPAVVYYSSPLLYLKGFLAIQSYRVAHYLWIEGRHEIAYFMQNLISITFGVDIHPAAKIGHGVMFDHATGIVIGETAVVGDNVSFLHNVTLGGTGHEQGDRHPKVRSGVMIGAGASVLGNIEIGEGAKIGAGSVVLHPVKPHTSVAGVPAKEIGICRSAMPSLEMDQDL